MSKHTPGPWEVLTYTNHDLQTDFAMVKIGNSAHIMGHTEQNKANAHLIASAPELLEALKDILRVYVALDDMGCEVLYARQAIAKAEGK